MIPAASEVVPRPGWLRRHLPLAMVLAALVGTPSHAAETPLSRTAAMDALGLVFLDTGFENASPLWYEVSPEKVIQVHLLYDHERASPNRAAGHIHFAVEGRPGSRLTFEFLNLDNVWNGVPGSVARELQSVVISDNGRDWRSVATDALPGDRVQLTVQLTGPRLWVARVEPYRLSDLDTFLDGLKAEAMVRREVIGKTVQGRDLEILRVGRPKAPYRVFVRARAHPWEAGGNWVVQGLVRRLLRGDAEATRFLERYRVDILPMANKDGVASGRTRFNARGKDLNRNWDLPADPGLSPENAALEQWLERQARAGERPHLALELHNDGRGLLHISRPDVPGLAQYLDRMAVLERLLRQHTWFTEGSTRAEFRNPGSLGDGWLERFGIDAVIHEFNCHWIAGLNERPLGRHWEDYGARLATVLDAYFEAVKPKG